MKKLFYLSLMVLVTSCGVYRPIPAPLELIIHTPLNIYYVNGLVVTKEFPVYEVEIFNTQDELREYLERTTKHDASHCNGN